MIGVLPIAKLAVHVVASVGVSKVVSDIVRNNTTITTTADAVKVWTGGFVIGAMVAEAAQKSVDSHWNSVATWYAGRKTVETDKPTTE